MNNSLKTNINFLKSDAFSQVFLIFLKMFKFFMKFLTFLKNYVRVLIIILGIFFTLGVFSDDFYIKTQFNGDKISSKFNTNLLYVEEYYGLFSIVFINILLGAFILFLALFVTSAYNPDPEKTSAYECGFDPYEDARNAFDVRFYLIAILFLLFDLEGAFLFSWSVSVSFLNFLAFWGMLDFIFELLIGLIFAWLLGSLDWINEKDLIIKKNGEKNLF